MDKQRRQATDDLDIINGGSQGQVLVLRANVNSRTVVCKDATGNLYLSGDMSLDHSRDRLVLQYSDAASGWIEISRSDNDT